MAERMDPTKSLKSQLTRGDSADTSQTFGSSVVSSWDNFSHWLCAVCVVTFDLELGQALEVHCY